MVRSCCKAARARACPTPYFHAIEEQGFARFASPGLGRILGPHHPDIHRTIRTTSTRTAFLLAGTCLALTALRAQSITITFNATLKGSNWPLRVAVPDGPGQRAMNCATSATVLPQDW